jgi:DNA-binding response OmpR family regulator
VADVTATRPRVLLVDRDASVRRVLATRLEREGFEVRQSDRTSDVDGLVADVRPDVVLVEVASDHGLTPLERLRSESDVPTIVLLSDGLEIDRVDALDSGADHYVEKPFSPRELVAKIQATLRRITPAPQTETLQFDGLVVDRRTRQVTVHGEPVEMPAREFDLLAFLAESPRQVFTRAQLLERVWSSDDSWLGASTVTEHVRRLRQRIEDDPKHPRWIVTVWSVGYRFEP